MNESDLVKKGQLLLEIDDSDLKISKTALDAQIKGLDAQIKKQEISIQNETSRLETNKIKTYRQIEKLQANINSANATYARAAKDFNRYNELLKSKAVSKAQLDASRNEYLNAKYALESQEKSLQELTIGATKEQLLKLANTKKADEMTLNSLNENELDVKNLTNVLDNLIASRDALIAQRQQVELNLSRTKLYAPCDGKVLEVLYQEGELVNANAPSVNIETNRHYYDVYISEKQATQYKAGDEVIGHAIALDEEVSGIVRFVQASPSFADIRMSREQGQADLTSYKMRVYVKDTEKLLVGMTVELHND